MGGTDNNQRSDDQGSTVLAWPDIRTVKYLYQALIEILLCLTIIWSVVMYKE